MSFQRTLAALGTAGGAKLPAENNQPVAEIAALLGRDYFQQVLFNLLGLLFLCETQPSADTYAVSVGDYGGQTVNVPHDKVSGLSPYPGEGGKLLNGSGHFAAEIVQKSAAHSHNAFRFCLVETAGLDYLALVSVYPECRLPRYRPR